MIGTTLGPYRVLDKLGEGGMGTVYRARDSRLDRDVALKILPESFASDPDRLMRFEREAKTLAALNHPNIAAIYGLSDFAAGPSSDTRGGLAASALVMELVEGEDLSERIARGAVPLDEALSIARQIADALEAAHEAGIIHRDLKPANIKVRDDGTVKVLDFGLAKALDPNVSSATSANSPTFTSPALSDRQGDGGQATELGMILGTAAYMAPEQAKGRSVDKRADIWAFGVVLHEMLTGRTLFAGETVSDVLAGVLKTELDFASLPASTPPAIRRLLRRCLDRDPRLRLRDMGDARVELTAPAEPDQGSRTAVSLRFASRPAAGLIGALGLALLALGLLQFRGNEPAEHRDVVRTSIALPHGHALVAGPEITRDGRRVAFVSTDGVARPRLYTRRLAEPELRMLGGTEEANQPFFSPDGRWIAFYARGGLFKTRVDGGEPVRLADAPTSEGGYWLEDGTIIFTPAWNSGLYRIDSSGGEPTPLLIPDRAAHYAYAWPFVLPGEQALLFSRWGRTTDVARLNLSDMSQSVVAPGQWRRSLYTASGHIVFAADGGELLVLPGDPAAAAGATPEAVLVNVEGGGDPNGYTRISVSTNGTLVYSAVDDSRRSLVIVDDAGRSEPLQGPSVNYEEVSVSPDGRRAAVTSNFDVFVLDLSRGSVLPLAPELPRSVDHPLWTPDGSRIVFASNHDGTWGVYAKAASGTGEAELVFSSSFDQYPTSMMRDGTIVFEENHDVTATDIWLLPPRGKPQPWLVTPASESLGRISPDDRLMAFVSLVSGRSEVYVQPLDRSSDAMAVSTEGGTNPVWSRAGDRLYFRQGNLMMSVPVTSRPFHAGAPEVLFDAGWALGAPGAKHRTNYDALPDGRFLMVKNHPDAVPSRINVIFNWFEELRARLPVK